MMDKLLFFDSTLRDGSHAIAHKINIDTIEKYCRAVDDAGFYVTIVGHGNGLGASSLQVGISDTPDQVMITAARNKLKNTRLGAFLIPGFGTIKDDIGPALDNGVDLVCIASHCTEADITRQHIEYVRKRGKEAYGILMMYHMTTPERLMEEAHKMQDYGALGVILMDSAGASVPDMVYERVTKLVDTLDIPVGFHAHNNLGLAIANSYTAIKAGATIIDGTVRGLGAGAGNCQLEVLIGLLSKLKIDTGVNLYILMDAGEDIVSKLMNQGISSISLISGLAGVFSGFAPHVKKAAEHFGVDPRDIFMELGRSGIVAGQEDFIIDVALDLANKKAKDQDLSF
jgi:4-hydroxy 2-oxovalerate aldolase